MTVGLTRNEHFDIQLDKAHCRENALAQVLGNKATITFELKSDFMFRRTANFFIELYQKGRPSGLLTTQADYVALEYRDRRYIHLPTPVLKAVVARELETHPAWKLAPGGDYDNYLGVCLNVAKFLFTDTITQVECNRLVTILPTLADKARRNGSAGA